MNFFNRHQKILKEYAATPGIILLIIVGCCILFRPGQTSWHQYAHYFFGSPLGMGLQLITVVFMGAYYLHRVATPYSPKYRGYFVAGTFFVGLVADGIYEQKISKTIYYASLSGVTQFFVEAMVFYCIYRLIILIPDRERKWVISFLAAFLSLHLLFGGYHIYKKVSHGYPCSAKVPPDLWYALVYKDPEVRCTP